MPSAQRVRWAKFRVFVTATAGLLILGVLAYLLTGGTLLQPKTSLRVYVPDASSLEPASPVRVNGIPVGKVKSVRLTGSRDPNRVVEIVFSVELEHLRDLPEDSTAQISAENVIGDKFLDISKGRSAKSIGPGGEIAYKPAPELIKALDLSQFEANLRGIDALLRDIEEGRTRVGQFVVGDELYQDVRRRIAELQSGLHKAADTTGPVGQWLYTDLAYRQVSEPLRRFDESLAAIQSGQGTAGRLLRDSADYDRLRSELEQVRASLADARAGRGPIGGFIARDDLYNQWLARVASISGTVDEWNARPAMTRTDTYEQLNGAAREARNFLRDFRRDPQKYLRMKLF